MLSLGFFREMARLNLALRLKDDGQISCFGDLPSPMKEDMRCEAGVLRDLLRVIAPDGAVLMVEKEHVREYRLPHSTEALPVETEPEFGEYPPEDGPLLEGCW